MFTRISLWLKRSWFGRNWDKVLWPIFSLLWLEPAKDLSHAFHIFLQERAPIFIDFLVGWILIPFEVNLLIILVFIFGYAGLYHFITKRIIRQRGSQSVFFEDFSNPQSFWEGPYWGGQKDSVSILNGHLTLRAPIGVWSWVTQPNENGALLNLRSGIVKEERYRVVATARSTANTTMGFKLWVHDATSRGENAERDPPIGFRTPTINYEIFEVEFVATTSNAMRIHLHAQAGTGSIEVRDVRVTRL